MLTINLCHQCSQNTAEVHFQWLTSKGQQQADFCKVCARGWWDRYGSTAGHTLTITELEQINADN